MDLEKITIKKGKTEFSINLKKHIELINELQESPENKEVFDSLYDSIMSLVSKYGEKSLFGWCKNFRLEKNLPNKKFEFKIEYSRNLSTKTLSIYLNGPFEEFTGIIGLSKNKEGFGKFHPYKMRLMNINGKLICRHDY